MAKEILAWTNIRDYLKWDKLTECFLLYNGMWGWVSECEYLSIGMYVSWACECDQAYYYLIHLYMRLFSTEDEQAYVCTLSFFTRKNIICKP